VPFSTVSARQLTSSRQGVPVRRPALGLLALVAAVLALSGCLQDARNADKDFTFNNPVDPTQISVSGVTIALISPSNSVALIVNASGASQDMTGWTLVNQTLVTTYTFPSFPLGASAFVRVHFGAGADTSVDLFSGIAWSPGNIAVLSNAVPTQVSTCQVGTTC
jgi:hypothetical protein